jgi:hypothetical protein
MIRDLSKRPKTRSEPYMAWVRSLPCCGCGQTPAGEAHHCISDRYGSSKASDLHTLPLCRACHADLHAGWWEWEKQHGEQWRHVAATLERAAGLGVIVIDTKAARECA